MQANAAGREKKRYGKSLYSELALKRVINLFCFAAAVLRLPLLSQSTNSSTVPVIERSLIHCTREILMIESLWISQKGSV